MKHTIYLILFAGLFMQSCTQYRPLTQDLIEDYGWSENELRKMQFYLSEDIVLRRVQTGGLTEIEKGRVKVIDGKKVNEIVLKEGTPGVLLFMPRENRVAISFEGNGDDKFLMFGPNPDFNDRYVLLGAQWNEKRGIVTYDGSKWVTPAYSSLAGLLIDMKGIKRIKKKRHVAGGRTLD